jgi:hypothetical protein
MKGCMPSSCLWPEEVYVGHEVRTRNVEDLFDQRVISRPSVSLCGLLMITPSEIKGGGGGRQANLSPVGGKACGDLFP